MSKSIRKLFVAVALFAPLASAGVVTYSSSADFAAATGVTVVENYGTLTDGQLITSGSTVDGITYSNFVLTGGATNLDITDQYNSFSGLSLGADHTDGGSNPDQTFFYGGEGATVAFSLPVDAFGIFFNVNPNSGSYGYTDSNGDTFTVDSASYDTASFVFAGLTSTTPISSVSFYSVGGGASFNVAEIEANTVPEPASWQFILAAGLGLLALRLFIRRQPCLQSSK